MVYDVEEKRVNRVLKIGRKYLTWIQNSVLEGEITESKYEKLKYELNKVIDEKADSIVIYINRTQMYLKKEIIGKEKNDASTII